jgi:hypothetical protein
MLCSQLTYVVGEVLRFTSIDVLEPLWGDMEGRLLNAGNMDEVRCGGGLCMCRIFCVKAADNKQIVCTCSTAPVDGGLEERLQNAGHTDEVGCGGGLCLAGSVIVAHRWQEISRTFIGEQEQVLLWEAVK